MTLNEEVTQLTEAMANATEIREKATVQSHGEIPCSKGSGCAAFQAMRYSFREKHQNMILLSNVHAEWLIIWQAIIIIRNYRYIIFLFILHCMILFFMMNKELHQRSYQHHKNHHLLQVDLRRSRRTLRP